MKKRHMIIAALVATLCLSAPMTSKAATFDETGSWKCNETGWWYEHEDGSFLTSGFYDIPDGDKVSTYYFDEKGYMAKGWKQINSKWYYFESNGAMVKGWKQLDGTWYYLSNYDGAMYSNGVYSVYDSETETSAKYLFDESGAMQKGGWNFVDGSWYYCDSNYIVQTGWLYIGGSWFYLGGYDGRMYADTQYYDSESKVTYRFKANGEMVTGWYNRSSNYSTYGNWVYCNPDGSAYTGWVASGSNWYYVDNGYMRTSQWINLYQAADGSQYYHHYKKDSADSWVNSYYVGRDGAMVKGWYYTENKDDTGYYSDGWMYTNPSDGSFYEGWVSSGSKWYYIDSDGDMVRGGAYLTGTAPKAPNTSDYKTEDGYVDWNAYEAAYEKYEADYKAYKKNNTYVFDASGAMVTGGWYSFNSTWGTTWYYANANGVGYDGWLQDGGNWYYIENGRMLTNSYTEDGYFVGADGVWR